MKNTVKLSDNFKSIADRAKENAEADQAKDILGSSEIHPATEATRPFRYVLRLLRGNETTPYVVHTETDPFTDGAAYYCGNYYDNMQEAYDHLQWRADRQSLGLLDFNHKRVSRK
jgi:hypothetical protein